jgi:diguanylate cyclase (GGDEF)-like protein
MKHKRRLSEALGRKVAFRVAALDFLSARSPHLRQARLIARPEFESLLSFVNIDEVTRVYNRRYFNDELAREVQRARRYGGSLSLLIIDLDDFKRLNDSFGHQEGDTALRKIGRLLRENTRQSDSVCRFGGDEFGVLLPETGHEHAANLAERIRRAVPRLALERSEGGDVLARGLTVSVGGATYPDDCDEAEELVALADQMCLDAKRAGKDRVLMTAAAGDLPLAAD